MSGDSLGRDAWDDLVAGATVEGPDDAAPAASVGVRVMAGLGGLLLAVLVTVATGGVALVGFVGMGITALICRARRRRYTRVAGWLGAMVTTMVALAAIAAVVATKIPPDAIAQIREQIATAPPQPQAPPDAVQRTIERIYPGSTAISTAQTRAMQRSMASSSVFWWSMAFGLLFACAMLGAMAGTAAWGSATVLLYGVLGRWPSPARAGTVPFADLPVTPTRDAFDAI